MSRFNNRSCQKSKKRHENDYAKDFNSDLSMDIYYLPKTMPSFLMRPPKKVDCSTKSSPDNLKKFIRKIVESQLWRYPDALTVFKSYIEDLFDRSDQQSWIQENGFYSQIYDKYLELQCTYNIQTKLGENTIGGCTRGENRAKTIMNQIIVNQPSYNTISPSCYLDIGCFDGSITKAIAKLFNLNKLQTHGVDIKYYGGECGYTNISFSKYDGINLPYSDNSFDFITCLMVLHHIPKNNLNLLMSEINRVMKPNGIIILREHNAQTATEKTALDIMHNFYDYVWNVDSNDIGSVDVITQETQWLTNYKTNIEWTDLFKSNGFNVHTAARIFTNFKINPFMSYMCSYYKPRFVEHTRVGEMFRILPDDLPREVYKRRTKEVKLVLHWGQRKLLLNEIEFLTLFLKNNQSTDDIYAIYAGSAPGTHILYLSKLFPTIHFELYDPRVFSSKLLKNTDMIKTHVQYFTHDTAKEWISTNHPTKQILFISDIRTATPETQTPAEVEARVKIDQTWQEDWYHIIKPDMAMFKFRLPWDDDTTEYLDGDVYIQPYPPPTSTETRLIVGKNAATKTYNNRKYEEQMFYFNNHVRPTEFTNPIQTINPMNKNGLDNMYDSAAEVYILDQYLKLKPPKTLNEVKQKIVRMVGEISHSLSYSRTLYSIQPIKEHKKNTLAKLQKLGYVPENIDLNQNAFNTYVIPRYDFFDKKGLFD
jgi:SAM-dependent methyltransferase